MFHDGVFDYSIISGHFYIIHRVNSPESMSSYSVLCFDLITHCLYNFFCNPNPDLKAGLIISPQVFLKSISMEYMRACPIVFNSNSPCKMGKYKLGIYFPFYR